MLFLSSLRRLRPRLTTCLVTIVCLGLVSVTAGASDSTPKASPNRGDAELQLRDGNHLTGTLGEGSPKNTIRWQTSAAVGPFDFVPSGVVAVYFPARGEPVRPEGAHCVELAGGDILFGSLDSVTSEQVELTTDEFGKLKIDASRIVRIVPWNSTGGITYLGPDGLMGWRNEWGDGASEDVNQTQELIKLGWRDAAGHLVVDRPGPPITRNCPIPSRCAIEVGFSWQSIPNYGVTFYVEAEQGKSLYPVRFQVLDHQLLLIAEGAETADLIPIKTIDDGGGRFHGILYVDGEARFAELFSVEGNSLGRVTLPAPTAPSIYKPKKPTITRVRRLGGRATTSESETRTSPGVTLSNRSSDFRFERLLIRTWDGRLPSPAEGGKGSVYIGSEQFSWTDITFDSESKQLVIATLGGEQRVTLDELGGLVFPPPTDERSATFRATLLSGLRVSGELEGCTEGCVVIKSPPIQQPLEIPLEELHSLVSLSPSSEATPSLAGRLGHLEWEGSRLKGVLVAADPGAGESALVWQAWGSTTPQPLAKNLAGRIVYNEPPTETVPTTEYAVAPEPQRPAPGLFQMIFGRGGGQPRPSRPVMKGSAGTLYLRSGDRFPGQLVRVTESAAHFESPITESKVVPLDQMVMWERDPVSKLDTLEAEKRRRLLTIPRMQRTNPPTHLLETSDGDFLRGRLVGVDEMTIVMEIRLDEKRVPLSSVRRILWLEQTRDPNAREASEDDPTEVLTSPTEGDPIVLAVQRSNIRLAFTPMKVAEGVLYGTSRHLGDCQIKLDDIDILYLGAEVAVRAQAEQLAKWQTQPAKDPKFVNEEEGGSPADAGTDAPLVGQPAPDFQLKTLDGKELKLSAMRGDVVVLDFFATWCGPCVQAMPQVDAITEEFAERGVRLVAVNMQEDKAAVEGLMERLKLNPTVALDIDGATAEKYGVTAIPQTVIVDREGKVARLFVGGGPTFFEQYRAALEALTNEQAPAGGTPAE